MIGFLNKTLNSELVKKHPGTMMLIWGLLALFAVSNVLFAIFLLSGSWTLVDLSLTERNALVADVVLSVIFFLQHSIMVRRGFRNRLARFVPEPYHQAVYGLISSAALLLVLMFWQKSSTLIYTADGITYWILRGMFLICIVGFAWGVKSLGSFDALGVKPLMRHISHRPEKTQRIMVKGPYRWTRHPLYLFMIVLVWSCPVLTLDRLIFNILWTGWIVIGTVLEDRDLHREFGNQYLAYSSKVPMLIPYKIPEK